MISDAATTVRFRVVLVCSVMSVLLYLDRFCVTFAEVFITEDLGLSKSGVSWMFGAFFFSYAFGQTPSGWLADRFGGRTMLTIYILAWTLFTGLIGLSNGIVMLVALRLGLGLAQAGAYPTCATLIAKWVPLTRRGAASSFVALGGRIGAILALSVTGFVILYFVPVSVPSTLTANEILAERKLSYELVYGAIKPTEDNGDAGSQGRVGKRLLESFPSELRDSVSRAAQEYRSDARQKAATSQTAVGAPSGREASASLRNELAQGLNHIIRQPGFFVEQDWKDVKIEVEAKRLLRIAPDDRSPSQEERLNRLILEGLYPSSIKKVYCAGWRKTMLLYGALGLPVALLFWVVCRDDPRKHPGVNAAELDLIDQGRSTSARSATPVGSIPFVELISNRSMWCNGAMQFFTNVGWVLLVTYTPRYFIDVHRIPVEQRAWLTTIPAIAGVIGMFCGGIITDPAVAWWGKRWGRTMLILLTRVAAGGTYLFCLLSPSPWTAAILLAATSFFCDLGIPAVWAFQQDVGGKYAGSVLGWGNMWGNLGAFIGPWVIAQMIGETQNWNAVFITSSVAFLLSGHIALGIDATRPIVREEDATVD